MSNKNYGVSFALETRSRREGLRGTSWKVSTTGLKSWARKCLAKLDRATAKAEISQVMAQPADMPEVSQSGSAEIRVLVKGQRSRKVVAGKAFTSPNPHHLRQEGFSSFGEFADARWFKLAA